MFEFKILQEKFWRDFIFKMYSKSQFESVLLIEFLLTVNSFCFPQVLVAKNIQDFFLEFINMHYSCKIFARF